MNTKLFAYSLADVVGEPGSRSIGPGLDLLIQAPDTHGTLASLIGEVHQGIVARETKWQNVHQWSDLLYKLPLVNTAGESQKIGDVQAVSVGRFRRLLRRAVETQTSGLFIAQQSSDTVNLGEEIRKLKGGETVVVDIAQLRDHEQRLVFGHIIKTAYEIYAEDPDSASARPSKVIIFVDELNKYAPARGEDDESSISSYVVDIAARGRSLGVVLISAEQFMSEVNSQVVGNCATKVIGRSDAAELSNTVYRFIPQDVRSYLTRLDKGQLLLSHPLYRQPVRMEFPLPAYQQIGH